MGMVGPVSSTMISQAASAHTLQAYVELVYVQTGNDVMVSQMASMEQALSTTQSALDTLTQIQNLHNLIAVNTRPSFLSVYPSILNPGTSVEKYRSAASAYFGSPVQVSFSFSAVPDGLDGFIAQRSALLTQLQSEIATLSAVTPLISGRVDSNSLYAQLKLVLKDFTPPVISAGTNPANIIQLETSAIGSWVIDNYNAVGTNSTKAGNIQQNITNAITAGQSLNTTQTESVRNFLNVFEQYYKSASSVLQAISQIIQHMASNIAR